MQPKTLSASALKTAMLCLARYEAENINYGRGQQGVAASLGTIVHAALELFVKAVYLEKVQERSLALLLSFFEMNYQLTFGSVDKKDEKYKDGIQMLKNWYSRADLEQESRTVISCEQKTHFDIYPEGMKSDVINFNYIWDRFDKTGENEYTVVDYKTNRWGVNSTDLRENIQARSYGLAAQLQYTDAERIWVEFDMLRHDGPVGVVFSKEDNRQTLKEIRFHLRRIRDTPAGNAQETLNEQCLFCVRKSNCRAVAKNITVGGIHSITSTEEMIDTRAQLDFQIKAANAALVEIDNLLLAQAKKDDTKEMESGGYSASVNVSSRRNVDAERVRMIIGDQLWRRYGADSITMGQLDAMLKSTDITDDQRKSVNELIYKTYGEPKIRTKAKAQDLGF